MSHISLPALPVLDAKHARLGVLSLTLGILAVLAERVGIFALSTMELDPSVVSGMKAAVWGGLAAGVLGMLLGVLALFQVDRRRIFAVAGVVVCSLVFAVAGTMVAIGQVPV